MYKILGAIGRNIMDIGVFVLDLCKLLIETLKWIIIGPFQKKAAKREFIINQMVFAGVDSLVIAFFVS
ncbi:MAG: hypothetical protein HQ575_00940, partial [Candidatus Omnitrophica bacterium]|nr:hypothetical protein [Candidatus Omnitrophota bacterium]